ncbi:hypothetical protein X801_01114 [Opisthorchis viverrini]|uniref:Uncharacterized protein n=1 Tax=Opisthorchis viverrini TaxID=6198 RepID=A0A1S8X8B5_OPIVI|nr:hypothetical protein X801_01114 [Opisthorchis viverrini]
MLEKIVEPYRDVNECQCRKRIRTAVRDCRCPTKMLIDGKCDGHRTHWDELMVEQQWSEEKRACVVERIRRARHHCRCDDPKVFKECAKGVMHETLGLHNKEVRRNAGRYDQPKRILVSQGCPKPKVQVNCQNNKELVGQVIYYTTHQQRCGHQCIEKTHAVHSEVDCHEYPPPPNGHWNDCDRRTCVQHFIAYTYEVQMCWCALTKKVLATRACCCSPNVRKEQKCTHGLPELVTYHTVLHDGRCVEVAKPEPLPLVCPTKKEVRHECPKPHVIREECDRDNTCLQTIKHVDFVLEDCHCKRLERAEKVSCCCPKSTVLGTRCLEESGQVETKTLFYELVNGQCARRVKLDRMPVPCPPPGAEKPTPSCDPQTCLEPVLEQRWFRVGCRCVEQKPQQFRTCCCSNRIVRAKRICNPDGSSLLRRITISHFPSCSTLPQMTQSWLFHNGHCVPQVITKRLDMPVCHPQRVTALACPAPVEHAEPCQPATCLQRIVRIPWALDEQKGQCVRLPLQVQMRPCCCLREKEPPAESTRCNPITGEVELTRRSFIFNVVKRVCEVQEDKRYNKLDCPSHGRILRGHCNQLNGIAIDKVEIWEARLSECQCRRMIKTIKRICLMSSEMTPAIVLEVSFQETSPRVCSYASGSISVCAEGEHPRFQCNPTTCDSVRTVSLVERVGCRCVPRVREERGKCCCPEPTEQQECTNGGRILVLHKLSFILDKTRQTCVPQKDKVQKEIVLFVCTWDSTNQVAPLTTSNPWDLVKVLESTICQFTLQSVSPYLSLLEV